MLGVAFRHTTRRSAGSYIWSEGRGAWPSRRCSRIDPSRRRPATDIGGTECVQLPLRVARRAVVPAAPELQPTVAPPDDTYALCTRLSHPLTRRLWWLRSETCCRQLRQPVFGVRSVADGGRGWSSLTVVCQRHCALSAFRGRAFEV